MIGLNLNKINPLARTAWQSKPRVVGGLSTKARPNGKPENPKAPTNWKFGFTLLKCWIGRGKVDSKPNPTELAEERRVRPKPLHARQVTYLHLAEGLIPLSEFSSPPTLIKPWEINVVNSFAVNLSDKNIPANASGKIELSKFLDKSISYMYAFVPPERDGDRPTLLLGFEHRGDSGKLLGHPTLFERGKEKNAIIAGELVYRGHWTINNRSGRYGYASKEARSRYGVRKLDLLLLAAQVINNTTDLNILSVIGFSEVLVKRKLQYKFPDLAANELFTNF